MAAIRAADPIRYPALCTASVSATLLGSAAGAAKADVDRVWFSGGEFTVRQIVSDAMGARWCSMVRNEPGGAVFDVAAFPDGFVNLVLIDSDTNWAPGAMRVHAKDRDWMVRRHATPRYPDQLSASLGNGA